MSCLSLAWVEQLCIDLIIICAIVAIIKLLIPFLTSLLAPVLGGGAGVIGQIIIIVLWAIVAIFVVYVIFALLGCLVGAGGFHIGSFHHQPT